MHPASKIMRYFLCLLPLLLAACNALPLGNNSADKGPPGDLNYYLVDLYAGYDVKVHIAANNDMTIEETKGPGPNDFRRIVSDIVPAEREKLSAALQGWSTLKEYYATDLTPLVSITYNGKKVSTSNLTAAPATFKNVKAVIDTMMVARMEAANEKTRAASATTPTP